jgi:hypothetical protein
MPGRFPAGFSGRAFNFMTRPHLAVFLLSLLFMRILGAALLLLSTFGCSSSPVGSMRDTSVDLSKYHTYAWVTQSASIQLRLSDPNVDYTILNWIRIRQRPDLESQIKPVVDQDLQKNGFFPALGDQKPDFYVTYYAKAKDEDWISTWTGITPGVNAPVIVFPNFDRAKDFQHVDGMVYLTFYGADSKKPIWTGRANTEAFGPNREPAIEAAVNQLVDEFKKAA